MIYISRETYSDLVEERLGICTACLHTRNYCEPDACNYKCDACGADQVFGAEILLVQGDICFSATDKTELNW